MRIEAENDLCRWGKPFDDVPHLGVAFRITIAERPATHDRAVATCQAELKRGDREASGPAAGMHQLRD
jgi:hypothetical protein